MSSLDKSDFTYMLNVKLLKHTTLGEGGEGDKRDEIQDFQFLTQINIFVTHNL